MRTNRNFVAFRAATAALLFAVSASGTDQGFPAVQICQEDYNAVNLRFDRYGYVYNSSSTATGYLSCGVGQDQALDTDDDVLVFYSDANAGNFRNVKCDSIELADDYSTVINNPEVYGCSTIGGCSTQQSNYVGSGHIRLVNVRHGGSYFTVVYCEIPTAVATDLSTVNALTLDE